jgi:hypothetical protein
VIGKRDGDYAATVTSVLDAYFAIRPLFDPETPVPPIGNAMKRS